MFVITAPEDNAAIPIPYTTLNGFERLDVSVAVSALGVAID